MSKTVNFWKLVPKLLSPPKFFSMSTSIETRIPQKNYYKILGVDAHASNKEIKAAYIRLAKMFHPDASGSSLEAKRHFQDLVEAYKVLTDVRKRRTYDKFGVANVANRKVTDLGRNISTNDYFKELLKHKSVIEKVETTLTFLQAIRGGVQTIQLSLETICKACEGVQKEKCITCQGSGKIGVQKNAQLTVPENIKTGQTVDIPSPLDPMKTLRVSFTVKSCTEFRQEGFNVHSSVEISLCQALLGDNVPIKGVYRDHRLRIPAGIQSNTVLKLPGRGIRKSALSHEAGDHFVTVTVVIPRRLTKTQLQIIREFAKTENKPKKEM